MDEIRKRIVEFADRHGDEYKEIALKIHEKPEVSNYEFFASEILSKKLADEGFEIELPAAGHRTGFAARYKSGKPGPVMCFLAEYDALAGLGHGCGHNLFGATSSLAGAALKSVIDEAGGEVRVYGTPGEEGGENGSAKGSFVREGYFKDVDAALSAHPGVGHVLTEKTLGCAPVDIEFWGKSSHAAAKFYIRAASAGTLDDVYKKVERIVEASALAMGAKGRMQPYQNRVENMVPTPLFDSVYKKNMEFFGEKVSEPLNKSVGSTDIGNVSQVIPAIQPKINISDKDIKGHSVEFVEASCSKKGLDSIVLGAKVLALTALDLIEDPELLKRIKEEHKYMVEHQGE